MTRHRTVGIDGLDVFYREAGDEGAPAILLLHGFPTSSHMFRRLLPRLGTAVRCVAPDLPGFGYTTSPPAGEFAYTFDRLAEATTRFVDRSVSNDSRSTSSTSGHPWASVSRRRSQSG